MDRREAVFLDDALRDQDRVLEVVAVPGHERDQHVLAKRQFAQVGGSTVGDHVAGMMHVKKSLIRRIRAEYGEPMKVIATGGLAEVFKDEIGLFDAIEPDLMSIGLMEIWRRNRK